MNGRAVLRWVQLLTGACVCTLAAATDHAISPRYFGFHAHRLIAGGAWPTVRFGSWRLWDSYVTWPYLEAERGQWTFAALDRYLALAERHRVELLLPLGLSPTWASARPRESSAYERPGWAAEPASLDDWRNYVHTVASRYKGRVRYYEIWNEPNLKRFFSGSVAKMVELTCSAYRAIKRVDAAAMLVSPAATRKEAGVQWLRTFMQAGGHACIDIVGFHFYTLAHEGPETMVPLIGRVREIAARYGKSAVWNTETGWYFANQRVAAKTVYRVQGPREAAGYVVRAFMLGAAAGLERFFWYAWDNPTMGGLIEPDTNEPKPAVAALRSALRWLLGARLGDCSASADGVWSCRLDDDRRGKGWVVWSPAGRRYWTLPDTIGVRAYETLDGRSGRLRHGDVIEVGELPVLLKFSMTQRSGAAHVE